MIRYAIFYDNIQIGLLEIQDGQHRYTPDPENINCCAVLESELLKKTDWRKPIWFFKERLDNAARFGRIDKIGYQTDHYMMRLIQDTEQA